MPTEISSLIFRVATTLIPLILAISVHEWAHVAMARYLGDDLGTRKGRFTLNPLAHIDPIWTVLVPLMLILMAGTSGMVPFFAAGKPAPYNPVRLDREFGGKRITLRTAELLVAAAGPTSNVILALLTLLVSMAVAATGVDAFNPQSADFILSQQSPLYLLAQFFLLNVALAVFNIIPVPPLDGSKVLMSVLSRPVAARYEELASRASWILLGVLFLGGARYVISPVMNLAWSALMSALASVA